MTPFDPFFHTVAILNSGRPNPEFVGSGVLLRIEGEDYIATAAHVVDELRGPVGIAVVKNMIIGSVDTTKGIVAEKLQDRTYNYHSGLDLALLLVTRKYRQFLGQEGMSFFDLDKNDCPTVTGACIISGYPGKMNSYDRKNKCYADTCNCYYIQSFMKNPERVLAIEGDPEFHFALETSKRHDFSDETNQRIPELFDLHGMSGGGAWHMTSGPGASIRKCATGIAGILVEDRDTKKDRKGMAKVVKIEAFRNLVNFAKSHPKPI